MSGSLLQRYGDNIYHRGITGSWLQEDSFHSQEHGVIDVPNLKRDTGTTENVLLGNWFIYWGDRAPQIPLRFANFVQSGVGHRSIDDATQIAEFVAWASSLGRPNTVIGDPIDWSFLEARRAKTFSA